MASPERQQLGRYRIEAELGRGAMGVVYKAHDPVLDRTVALKTIVLDENAQDREEYEGRFFQEAKAAARLNHPALITIYDFGEEDALAYMAMELLDGHELAQRMANDPPCLREEVLIAEQVAEGLAFAHDNGVIHRDVKPGNIMLLARGRIKIMDFGIARLKTSEHLTQTGTRLGTPKYMSPEQVGGGALDHRTDIFSLGIVLYEMLTGGQLFHAGDLTQVMHKVASFEPPPPSRINPAVPPMLDLVVKRALEKSPAARYANAWEMVDDLRHCLEELAPSLPAPNDSTRGPRAASAPDEDAGKQTLSFKPPSDAAPRVRRISAQADSDNRLAVSRRFDSVAALARVRAPASRDRRRLARAPRSPGLLRRLRHDRDLMWFTLTLGLAALFAALMVLS